MSNSDNTIILLKMYLHYVQFQDQVLLDQLKWLLHLSHTLYPKNVCLIKPVLNGYMYVVGPE